MTSDILLQVSIFRTGVEHHPIVCLVLLTILAVKGNKMASINMVTNLSLHGSWFARMKDSSLMDFVLLNQFCTWSHEYMKENARAYTIYPRTMEESCPTVQSSRTAVTRKGKKRQIFTSGAKKGKQPC